MRARVSIGLVVAILAGFALVLRGEPAKTPQWGTVKGQVVWTDQVIPRNPPIPGVPPGGGAILQNKYVIDPQTKGIRWVLVWLADPKDATNAKFVPPIHPSFTLPPPDAVVETPRLEYEPRVLGLWVNQDLVIENPGAVAIRFEITSIGLGPVRKVPIPPKISATINGFVPKMLPTPFGCGLHRWMKGYVGSFAHPYFAVTNADGKFEIKNAPAGKFQLVLWHEEVGFLTMTSKRLRGKVLEIKGKGVTDVGKIGMKPVDD